MSAKIIGREPKRSAVLRLNERDIEHIQAALGALHVYYPRLDEKLKRAAFACKYKKRETLKSLAETKIHPETLRALREDYGSSNPVKGRPRYLIKNYSDSQP